jgi:hypothetical protein
MSISSAHVRPWRAPSTSRAASTAGTARTMGDDATEVVSTSTSLSVEPARVSVTYKVESGSQTSGRG